MEDVSLGFRKIGLERDAPMKKRLGALPMPGPLVLKKSDEILAVVFHRSSSIKYSCRCIGRNVYVL